jgi:hypothetical protein
MAEPKAADWLNRKRAAQFLADLGCPVSTRTLELWASNGNAGKGPPFVRVRTKIIRYLKADLQAWASREIVRVE